MAETITLDPSAVATGRTQFDLTPFISVEGVDWGDAQITAQIADGQYGGDPVDFKVPNRQVTIPLKLMARGTATFEQSRRWVQSKAALFQREGGWLSRVTGAGTLYADVVNATLKLGGDWLQANRSADIDATLSLELKPDWYGAEITLDDKTETTLPVLTTVLKLSTADATIGGDYPARVRVVVDEDDGDTQLGLIWGFRSRYYDAATTAALFYQAEALTPLDTAATAVLSGASGGTVVRHASLAADWTPVLSTRMLSGTADLTHRGTYRVWARCYSTSAAPPTVRFVWDVGDLAYPTENTPKTIPAASNFYNLDLGEIRLDAAPVGTHRWQGQVHAKAVSGGDNVSVDTIMFQPIDDGAGRLIAPPTSGVAFTGFQARDEFTSTTSGNALNARVAPVGGTWVTSVATTDYAFIDAGAATNASEAVARSATSATQAIRYATLGTALTNTDVRVRTGSEWLTAGAILTCTSRNGILARLTDQNNHLRWYGNFTASGASPTAWNVTFALHKFVAGVDTTLYLAPSAYSMALTSNVEFYLSVTSAGRLTARVFDENGSQIAEYETVDPDFATGGTLASGMPGIMDSGDDPAFFGTSERWYDDFRVFVPAPDAVLFANQAAQLGTTGILREDSTGVAYGPVSSAIGDLPRLPPSGLENRKVELFVKASRGDFDQLPDSGIDDISAQAFYRPGWLIAPGS